MNTENDSVQNPKTGGVSGVAAGADRAPASTKRFDRFLVLLLAGVAMVCGKTEAPPHEAAGQAEEPTKIRVRMVTHREGDVIHFSVENLELTEVTGSFHVGLANLQSTVAFPYLATFPPGTTPAFSLAPLDPGQPSDYSFTNYYVLGGTAAVHDDSYRYSLPYAPGSAFRVSQGYGGTFSHQGSNQHSIDWRMPVGTPVRAARGGVIVKIKDGSDLGGAHARFACHNNYVLIRHEDGTLGQYCHLKKGGVKWREGDRVTEGDVIALSGNTGFSSGPHLHFSVYRIKSGNERESIPVKFRTAEGEAVTLKAGGRYTASRASANPATPEGRRSSTPTGSAGT